MVKKDFSFGVIPLKKIHGEWQAFLIHHVKGHWAFPKGHKDNEETPLECAFRELKEETGLNVLSLLPCDPLQEHYFFTWKGERIEKSVIYFSALVEGEIKLELREVDDGLWLNLKKAEKKATYQGTKKICRQLVTHLANI